MKLIDSLFQYQPENNYNFNILDDKNVVVNKDSSPKEVEDIFPNLQINLEHIKTRYNFLLNSDIVIREFTLNCRDKQYNSFIIFIDGMIDSNAISDFVLESLMLRNKANTFDGMQNKVVSEAIANNITIRKVKKFNLEEYIYNCLVPRNSVKKCTKFSEIISGINSGDCALFIDTINTAFDIDVKGYKQRNISTPENEVIIKGPQEAFVENIRTNTSQIRRIVNNEHLIIESIPIGDISKTQCAVCYMENITNPDLVAEVKFRLNNLSIDTLLSSGQLEQLIEDTGQYGIPQILS